MQYVARLPDGYYIYSIRDGKVSKCASRIRAVQFDFKTAQRLRRLLKIVIVRATWDRL